MNFLTPIWLLGLLPWAAVAVPCALWTRWIQSTGAGELPRPLWQRGLVAADAIGLALPWRLQDLKPKEEGRHSVGGNRLCGNKRGASDGQKTSRRHAAASLGAALVSKFMRRGSTEH